MSHDRIRSSLNEVVGTSNSVVRLAQFGPSRGNEDDCQQSEISECVEKDQRRVTLGVLKGGYPMRSNEGRNKEQHLSNRSSFLAVGLLDGLGKLSKLVGSW